jgi:hypothetical protein
MPYNDLVEFNGHERQCYMFELRVAEGVGWEGSRKNHQSRPSDYNRYTVLSGSVSIDDITYSVQQQPCSQQSYHAALVWCQYFRSSVQSFRPH